MAARLNPIELKLLKFIAERGEKGITRIDLRSSYQENDRITTLALTKLKAIGLISEEFARVKNDKGGTVVTKLIKARLPKH